MKTPLLTFLFLLQSFFLLAQKEFTTIKGDFSQPYKIVLKKNAFDNFCTYFRQADKDLYFVTNKRGTLLNQFELPRTYPDKTYYGGFSTDQDFLFFFKDNDLYSPSLEVYAIPVAGRDIKTSKIELPNDKAQFLAAISNHNSYHLVYLLAKERKVRVIEVSNITDIKTYDFLLNKKQFKYLRNKSFKAIKSYQEYSPDNITTLRKIYITDNNKIVITIDNKYKAPDKTEGNTKVLVLKKESLSIEEKDFPLVDKKYKRSNSFYCNEMLYKVAVNKKRLGIYVSKIADGETVSSMEYPLGQLSEVFGDGNQQGKITLTSPRKPEIKEKTALKFFSRNKFGAAVAPVEGGVALLIAGYDQKNGYVSPTSFSEILTYVLIGGEQVLLLRTFLDTTNYKTTHLTPSSLPFFSAKDFYWKSRHKNSNNVYKKSYGMFKNEEFTYVALYLKNKKEIKLYKLP